MPKGDPRQAKLVTTWALRGDKIYFDETAQYQFVGKDGACTASARRTRLLSRSAQDPAPASEAPPQAAETPAEKETKDALAAQKSHSCTGRETPETIVLTPRASVLRGGDRLEFDVVLRGEHGCPVREKPHVEIASGQELIEVTSEGAFRVLPSAASGRVTLRASAGVAEAAASVVIVSQHELKSLLGDAEGPGLGSNPPLHVDATTSTEAHGESDSRSGTLILGLLIAVFGCGGVLYWFRRSPPRQAADVTGTSSTAPSDPAFTTGSSSVDPGARTVAGPDAHRPSHPVERAKGRLCPVCGERYPIETLFCGKEGARLVREN